MVRSPTNAPGLPPTNWAHILITLAGVLCLLFLFFFAYYRIFRKQSRSSRAFVFRNRSQRQRLNESNPDDPTLQFHSNGLAYPIFCSLPTIQFRKKSEGETGQGNTDCAVCLGEFKEDEWLRYLPSCSHYFHTSCIDTWFQTHSSCPLCRSNVMDNAMDQDRNFVAGPFSLESLRREDIMPQRTGGYQVLFDSLQIQQLERNQEIPTESTQSQT